VHVFQPNLVELLALPHNVALEYPSSSNDVTDHDTAGTQDIRRSRPAPLAPVGQLHPQVAEASRVVSTSPGSDGNDATFARPWIDCPGYPPAGLLAWHYTQCVLQAFATREFRALRHVAFTDLPTRYRDDSDDDESSSPTPPEGLYPAHGFDMFLSRLRLKNDVLEWQKGTAAAMDS
jgi:hypothetical protein